MFVTAMDIASDTVYNDRHGAPVPIGTRVMVRLQSTPAAPKMRWMWAMHMIMSKREHNARRAIVLAKFRVERLRDRVNKLVRFLYIITVTTLEREKSFAIQLVNVLITYPPISACPSTTQSSGLPQILRRIVNKRSTFKN